MNHHLNPRRTGLSLGFLMSGLHLVWAILVALGWAQAVLDFASWAHMVNTRATVGTFDMTAAVTLIILTFAVGYVVGWVFAKIWNRVHN